MNAVDIEREENGWQHNFASLLPEIHSRLRLAFCRLDPASRDEAISEGITHSLLAYAKLHEQNRAEVATPASLAFYSSLQVKRGRPAVGRMNGQDVLSRYAEVGRGIRVERHPSQWIDAIIADKRAAVPDQVAAKLDVGAWWGSLTKRMKGIARDLSLGYSTSEVASNHGVTAGRISQLRRKLEESWTEFQLERAPSAGRC